MILYALKCSCNHQFESWFKSGDAFDKLKQASMVNCPLCGGSKIEKALMSPKLSKNKAKKTLNKKNKTSLKHNKSVEEILRHIRDNSEYVGVEFVSEVRAIHAGETPKRSIYGEAKPQEAQELLDEGIPIASLPIIPPSKIN